MTIVTKTGDKGTTGLFGGKRLPKHHPRIEAYGTVDELNAILGVILAERELPESARQQLTKIQHLLFRVGGDLATPLETKVKMDRVGEEHVHQVEAWIAEIEASLPEQRRFILPGGSRPSAFLHLARTVCRRAERQIVCLSSTDTVHPQLLMMLNRLSDYLFLLARKTNADLGTPDIEVRY